MTDTTSTVPRQGHRQIWGSAARLVVGVAMIAAALLSEPSLVDAGIALVVLPPVGVLVFAACGRDAEPLRLYGQPGHCLNCAIGFGLFVIVPVAALLFYGTSILLAMARGYAGYEIFAIQLVARPGRPDRLPRLLAHRPLGSIPSGRSAPLSAVADRRSSGAPGALAARRCTPGSA